MIAGLKPYPAYKDSGVSSLGPLPEHWQVRRQRNVVQMLVSTIDKHSVEGELSVRLCNYTDVYKNERITETISFMRATATKQELERFRLRPDDVLITKDSEEWNDIGVPALVEYAATDLVCGYHLAILRSRQDVLKGGYLLRALQSPGVAVQYHVSANGVTRYGLSHDAIKSVILPIPQLPEQAAIIRFLDYAGRRIRRYIRAKQKLIALLNEQKRAIINRAVTRGLDPNVPLKPSGAQWLGDVPQHWQVKPLKHLVPQVTVGIVIQPARLYVESGVPCLRSLNISTGVIKRDDLVFISHESNARQRKSQISARDIVVVRTGLAGVAAIVPDDFNGANCIDLLIIRRSPKILSEYLLTFLNSWSAKTDVQYRSVGAIQAHYNTTTLANLIVAAPPVVEQQKILNDLAAKTEPISRAIAAASREIELARQYRDRLLADIVTGKLDVREVAARLPEEPAQLEPLEEAEPATEGEDLELDSATEEAEA